MRTDNLPPNLVRLWHDLREREQKFTHWWNAEVNSRTIAILFAVTVPLLVLYGTKVAPPSEFPVRGIVTVPEGATLREVTMLLNEQQVVQSPRMLEVVIRLMGGATSVHAGDYQFAQPVTVFTVARAVVYGYFGLEPIRIRVPEGATAAEMARIFARVLPRFDAARFAEQGKEEEGYLFPDTYFFLPNATDEVVLKTMRATFDEKVAPLAPLIASSTHSLDEVITIASLLEKEARIHHDRRMIAGVIENRLRKDMALQLDAAFLYIMGKHTFTLTREDLKYDSPYNTYRYKGLPPGAIANPSLSSIEAALTPIAHKYIFYLADNSGTTHYSVTYEEHVRKKNLYLGN